MDRAGCVVSFPGTPAQQLHTDGAPLSLTRALTLTLTLTLALTLTRYIPSDMAYGDGGRPPKIGGGDVLIFSIES